MSRRPILPIHSLATCTAFFFGSILAAAPLALAADGLGESVLTPSAAEKYQLRHQLTPDQTIRYKVTHVAKTKTRMNGTEEIANVYTTSVRSWKVQDVSENQITFDHQIDSVEMTQQNGDQDEIQWSSLTGEKPPAVFSIVAEQIGTPLSTVTIDPQGTELNREVHAGSQASLGMGSLTLTLPSEPIAIGDRWMVPSEVKVRTEDQQVKTIKTRQVFTLKKVSAGVATIAIKSQTLTPIHSEALRAQVIQQLSNGAVRFDIDNGCLLSKELEWDETVVGFQGPGSMMEYRAKMDEELIDEEVVLSAAKSGKPLR
ncbi:hypothetical protein [Allorhodopirellula heiligendammensis]|uniref:Secreted protein n=1 Tax=Allorhodopirellula heiligendammensis TaxID=2714739 RepID=A0A5C6BWG0_9BACT|nr:hypothetical protein [Allorhodopirellula heiligendammensis]TWU15114.1 hypothetical protein Poly21_23060 [Allorhodopirellula heiligendammensis]